jgi:Tfp pilus assembly protein PilO
MSQKRDSAALAISRYGDWLHACGLAVAGALFCAVYVPAIGALRSEQARIEDDISSARRLLDSAEDLRREHRDLSSQEGQAEARTEQLLARIPHAPQESEFLAHVARLAQDAPLSLKDFRPSESKSHDRFSEMEIQLSAEGSYTGICRFLTGLENLPRLCSISRLSIDSERGSNGNYPVELTLMIYFTPPEAAAGQTGGGK